MSDLIIGEPLAGRIREIAAREQREPDEVIATMVDHYTLHEIHNPPPRPHTTLTDADIDVPANTPDPDAYRHAVRKLRPKPYRLARRYWQKVGDTARRALTDEELDKQFWLIDHDGIPRLKSERDSVELPPDPLDGLVGGIGTSG